MAIEIVSFPIKNGGSFHSYVNVYQRVDFGCGCTWWEHCCIPTCGGFIHIFYHMKITRYGFRPLTAMPRKEWYPSKIERVDYGLGINSWFWHQEILSYIFDDKCIYIYTHTYMINCPNIDLLRGWNYWCIRGPVFSFSHEGLWRLCRVAAAERTDGALRLLETDGTKPMRFSGMNWEIITCQARVWLKTGRGGPEGGGGARQGAKISKIGAQI